MSNWHKQIEAYTPDHKRDRLLFAGVSGPVSVICLTLSLWGFFPLTAVSLLASILAIGIGSVAGALTLVVLWPVYLSYSGTIESVADYSGGLSTETEHDESIDKLKHQYTTGEISTEEFERQLESSLHKDISNPDRLDTDAADTSTNSDSTTASERELNRRFEN